MSGTDDTRDGARPRSHGVGAGSRMAIAMPRMPLGPCAALFLAVFSAGCIEPAATPVDGGGAEVDPEGQQPDRAPAVISPQAASGSGDGAGGEGAATAVLSEARATELAASTAEVPDELEALSEYLSQAGEAATVDTADIAGLGKFLAAAVRLDAQQLVGLSDLRDELAAEPSLIEDQDWLASAIASAGAAGRVGRTMERELAGTEWPDDMRSLVDDTLRRRIAVPLNTGAAEFRAAATSGDAEAAQGALEELAIAAGNLVAVLDQLPELMLAAEQATQTAEAASDASGAGDEAATAVAPTGTSTP